MSSYHSVRRPNVSPDELRRSASPHQAAEAATASKLLLMLLSRGYFDVTWDAKGVESVDLLRRRPPRRHRER